ncbi:hypothetical protein [Bradyrhizobium sp. LB13.1]
MTPAIYPQSASSADPPLALDDRAVNGNDGGETDLINGMVDLGGGVAKRTHCL